MGVIIIPIDVADLQLNMEEKDDRVVLRFVQGGFFERESVKAWVAALRPGETVLDIGSYSGFYSIIAAKRGCPAHAFEPMIKQAHRTRVNSSYNSVADLVRIHNVAVSDTDGMKKLHYNPNVPLTSGASLEYREGHAIDWKTVAIDSMLLRSKVCAIKIDVEEHEPAVIRGAIKLIERDKPVILAETLQPSMRDQIIQLLPAYKVAAILDGRNTLFVPNEEET